MQKIPITPFGYRRLEEELTRLVKIDRPAVIQAISTAREHGDLSENAEYHAARERQSFLEGRIQELQSKIGFLEVIDPSTNISEKIVFGATVRVRDADQEVVKKYTIVGEDEADTAKGWISVRSPLARALIGKTVQDEIEVDAPGGKRYYEVIEVKYIAVE